MNEWLLTSIILKIENCTLRVEGNYDTAVVNACDSSLFEKTHQEMVLKVVSSVNLKPISMVNNDGEEFNVLMHEIQFQQIQEKNDLQSS